MGRQEHHNPKHIDILNQGHALNLKHDVKACSRLAAPLALGSLNKDKISLLF